MRDFLLLVLSSMFFSQSINAQSLSLGSGYFNEYYRPIGDLSQYHSNKTSYFWLFLGGSVSLNLPLNSKWFKSFSIYSNLYPLMYGSDLTGYPSPENSIYVISQDLITPELGVLSYYELLNKSKHKIDIGVGISTRFVISPVTGSQSSYYSSTLSYESAQIQKNIIALLMPIDFRYTYNFKPQLGLFISMKRTFGLYHWIEQQVSYKHLNSLTNNFEYGSATMVSNGSRTLIELGLVFNLKRID
jgi:hypothetical protein